MSLGRFGSKESDDLRIRGVGGGGGDGDGSAPSLLAEARQRQSVSPEGSPATPAQLLLPAGSYSNNLLRNSAYLSWSAGVALAPDAWVLTGGSASVARNTTNLQRGQSSIDITNNASTAADLGQSLTISATENTFLRGRIVNVAGQIKVGTADRVTLKLDDGVNTKLSVVHTGSGSFERLDVSIEIDGSATKIEASIEISSGTAITATADALILSEGTNPVGWSPNIVDLLLVPRSVFNSSTDSINPTISSDSGGASNHADIDDMLISNVVLDGKQSVLLTFTGFHQNDNNVTKTNFEFVRDSTRVPDDSFGDTSIDNNGASSGTKGQTISMIFIDRKPTAGVLAYKVRWFTENTTEAFIFQRSFTLSVFPDE